MSVIIYQLVIVASILGATSAWGAAGWMCTVVGWVLFTFIVVRSAELGWFQIATVGVVAYFTYDTVQPDIVPTLQAGFWWYFKYAIGGGAILGCVSTLAGFLFPNTWLGRVTKNRFASLLAPEDPARVAFRENMYAQARAEKEEHEYRSRGYLDVPPEDETEVAALGATYDPLRRRWYYDRRVGGFSVFERWSSSNQPDLSGPPLKFHPISY